MIASLIKLLDIGLLENNARVGSQIAVQLSEIRRSYFTSSSSKSNSLSATNKSRDINATSRPVS